VGKVSVSECVWGEKRAEYTTGENTKESVKQRGKSLRMPTEEGEDGEEIDTKKQAHAHRTRKSAENKILPPPTHTIPQQKNLTLFHTPASLD